MGEVLVRLRVLRESLGDKHPGHPPPLADHVPVTVAAEHEHPTVPGGIGHQREEAPVRR